MELFITYTYKDRIFNYLDICINYKYKIKSIIYTIYSKKKKKNGFHLRKGIDIATGHSLNDLTNLSICQNDKKIFAAYTSIIVFSLLDVSLKKHLFFHELLSNKYCIIVLIHYLNKKMFIKTIHEEHGLLYF